MDKLRDGVWRGRVSITGPDGKRRQVSKNFEAKKEKEAWIQFDTWRLTIQKTPFIPGTVTVSSVLDFWEEYYRDHSFQDGEMKETTKENYYYVAKRIRGYMGRKKVEDLKLMALQAFIDRLKGEKITNKYIREHVRIFKAVLKFAHNHEVIYADKQLKAFELLRLPKKERGVSKTIQHEELKKIEDISSNERPLLWRIIKVAKYTGMRRSEILGLKWTDIQEDCILVLRQLKKNKKNENKKKPKFKLDDTKTKEGVRAIPIIRQLKKVLTTHLAEQESLKSLIGDAWENPDFIFTNEFGEFIDPNLVSAWFRQTRKKAGIKRKVTLHNVRHYYSSFLSSQGISNKTISALLGHTDESFSYDTYIHALDEETKKAAQIFEEALDKHFETEPPTHNE